MTINYWDCDFTDYNEERDELGEEIRLYGCTHPKGEGYCHLDNKWHGDKEDCKLLDKRILK